MGWRCRLFGLSMPAARPRRRSRGPPVARSDLRVVAAAPPRRGPARQGRARPAPRADRVHGRGQRRDAAVRAGGRGPRRGPARELHAQPARRPGLRRPNAASYPWSRRFFGDDSSGPATPTARGARLTAPVTADVVSTSDLGRFSAYGIEACYKFHGYVVQGAQGLRPRRRRHRQRPDLQQPKQNMTVERRLLDLAGQERQGRPLRARRPCSSRATPCGTGDRETGRDAAHRPGPRPRPGTPRLRPRRAPRDHARRPPPFLVELRRRSRPRPVQARS